MHPNPAFRQEASARHIAFARERGFGTLAVNETNGPLLSHVPFLLDSEGAAAELHLVRSNPIAQHANSEQGAVIAVTGPHGYISPDWYELEDQVPTWNYVAVHLRGRLRRLDDFALAPMLDRLAEYFENRLAPKVPWRLDELDSDVAERLRRQIVPFRFEVESIDGTWKLSQNKPDAARLAAADAVGPGGLGDELFALADLMRNASENG